MISSWPGRNSSSPNTFFSTRRASSGPTGVVSPAELGAQLFSFRAELARCTDRPLAGSVERPSSLRRAVSKSADSMSHAVVVGAGVFGTWAALSSPRRRPPCDAARRLRPGHSRSSSGDESRIVRCGMGQTRSIPSLPYGRWSSGGISSERHGRRPAAVSPMRRIVAVAEPAIRTRRPRGARSSAGRTRWRCSMATGCARAIPTSWRTTSARPCSNPSAASSWHAAPCPRSQRI